VTRTVFAEVPPRVEYDVTELGRTLSQPVLKLAMWAADNQAAIIANRDAFDDAAGDATTVTPGNPSSVE
jgi:DNA-binding HxlR family transcriptional regulator